jgi:chromosome segregation protein
MKIKKLSIFGFKSFMSKLEVTFPLGISGVVGPNGCGKSNIVDAIRWCMGEQSPKQLRGRRMEDVIFGGAGDHKPLGMAEVSILFENGDGSVPTAFANDTEISVTRRLYRSGESEYLINNVPCRLKDIQEIFMDTGLGNRAYSVIGQGKISTILEQKPEETRVMLEEAAGITKYRRKAEASQKKIELTEANLQRVEDILGEVQRQMRTLKRQASKARRYKAISQEIQNLELTLYANSYYQFKEESGDKLRSTEDLVQQEIAQSTRLSQFHAQIETMHLELEEKETGVSECRQNYLRLKERVHKKEADIESLTGEIRMQEEMKVRLTSEQEEIRKRLTSLKEEKAKLGKEIDRMREGSSNLEGEIALKDKRLKARRDFLIDIKEDYEGARAAMSAGATKEVGLSHESGYLSKTINQITDNRSRLEKELRDFKARMEGLIKASERKGLAREAAAERLEEIEASIEQENMSCEELEQMSKRVEGELKSAEADLTVYESRLASLKALTENFEGYQMGVRTIMKAKDLEPHQHGHILGLVADVIQVAPQYEQVVEAVLADRLQYIIVESQEDGKQAVDYLKKRSRGRSSFVPLKGLNGNVLGHDKNLPYPLLRDLVTVPDAFKPLVEALLGDTVLVEDLDTAISAWQNNGRDLCFATGEGDIVDQRGVISGGRLTQSSRGLLARKREIAELKEKCVHCRTKVVELKSKLEDIIADIQERKTRLDGLTEDKWACKGEINELDKKLYRLGQEMDQLEKLSQKISEDLESKGREQYKHKEELLKVEKELNECKEKRKQEEEYFRKKEIELRESEEEFDQQRDELARLKTEYGIFKEEQRSVAREMERLDEYAHDSLKRLERIEEDISLGHRRREECQRRKEALREQLKELNEKLREAEEGVNQADAERQALQERIKEEERKVEQLRGEIEGLKEEINRAKMEHSEIHFKMNNLVEVVKEKWNMNLLSIYEQYLDEGFSATEVGERLEHKKSLRQGLGEVNLTAIKEHEALKERYEFIKNQREDLISSIESLRVAIKKINRTSLEKFMKAFEDVDKKLKEIFPILFNGGTAGLRLIDETTPLESGVLVEVQPPGKKLSHMGLLSGGEKALVAMSLLFAIYMIKPSPFCLLDEVDAPLDEANIDRFNKLLREIRRSSQIIMVTHSRRTMEITDRLYGITMEDAGISKIVSVDIEGMKNLAFEGPRNDQPSPN